MLRTSLVFAAFVPFVAVAQGTGDVRVDAKKLQRAVPATALLDEEVQTKQGEEVGDVEDIIVSNDGQVEHFLVDADLSKLKGGEARLDRDKGVTDETGEWDDERVAAETEEAGREAQEFGRDVSEEANTNEDWSARRQEADRATDWMGEEFTPVKPDNITFDGAQSELVIEASTLERRAQSAGDSPQGMRVSEIVGMEVNLSDDDSFGRVEDVMMNEDGSEIVALVVDNWDGLDKSRRALPMDGASFNSEEEEITYSYSSEQMENVPEFNLDEHTENGWNVDDWL